MSDEEATIRGIFERLDKDGSGVIEAAELVNVFKESERQKNPCASEDDLDAIAKKKASHILIKSDKNNDMKITFPELLSALSSYVD